MSTGAAPQGEPSASTGRAYAGLDTQQRRLARRERMLEAATDLFGQREGWTVSTVERICSQAGVATRSVYEEFGSREGLLLAVYTELIEEAAAHLETVLAKAGSDITTRVQSSIDCYIGFMTADVRRARIAHVSMRRAGEWAHSARRATLTQFNGRVEDGLARLPGHENLHEWNRLAAVAITGAVNELIADWAESDEPGSPQALSELIVEWIQTMLASRPGAATS